MSNTVKYITVDEGAHGQRLDNFLRTQLKGVPKSLIYKIIRRGEVRVNKSRAKPLAKLNQGDVVRVPPVSVKNIEEAPLVGRNLAEYIRDSVLFENQQLMVINKPPGLAVHGGSGISLGLIEAARQVFPTYEQLELVHRLDRDTSGCIMLAKKKSCLRYMQELLRQGKTAEHPIRKTYNALTLGQWPARRRHVDVPLKKDSNAAGEKIVRVDMHGKGARTEFELLRHYQGCSLIQAAPITGRTHQIRVHAQYLGFPLVGDTKYGDDERNAAMKSLGFKRMCLHASELEFTLANGERVNVKAPLPPDISEPLACLAGSD